MSCLDYIARLVCLLYWEWVLGQPSGAAYNYASIEPGSCFCGASILAPPPTPGSPSLCNTLCTDDTMQLCRDTMVPMFIVRRTSTLQVEALDAQLCLSLVLALLYQRQYHLR